MSNHYHLVLFVDAAQARKWTQREIVERWTILFRAPNLVRRWQSGEALEAEQRMAEAIIERWRLRLCDISWFMRCLNEHLARLANAEDQCTGRFWEGRFKSQALLYLYRNHQLSGLCIKKLWDEISGPVPGRSTQVGPN